MTDQPARIQPPVQLLVDLAEERLGLAEVEALELMFRADGLDEAPPWVLRRAERIAAQRASPRQRDSWTTSARRFVAALTFDSQVHPQFAGLRATRTQVRRLLFQAENIEVDLEMSPSLVSEQVRLGRPDHRRRNRSERRLPPSDHRHRRVAGTTGRQRRVLDR